MRGLPARRRCARPPLLQQADRLHDRCGIDGSVEDFANAIAADGHPVDLDDLAGISSITHVIRRFGN
ncbi:hypothetical protein [Nonomuraea sp. NPDC003804]|uniref:hypothetical protein n=1 Tax=Nonomuraea sp. NPDC003804 TaxID=3154547 RepID=UPI0033B00AC8